MAEKEYIDKQAALRDWPLCDEPADAYQYIKNFPAADVRPVTEGGIGEMSDGYHTFNGLYYQRMILFAALVKAYKDKAWWNGRNFNRCSKGIYKNVTHWMALPETPKEET